MFSRSAPAYAVLLVLPAVAAIGLFFVVPLALLVAVSLHAPALSPTAYQELFDASAYPSALARTLRIGAEVAVAAVALGYPVAYLAAFAPQRFRLPLLFAVLLPFWTSILVRNYSWIYLLQQRGLVNAILLRLGLVSQPLDLMYDETAVLVGMTHALLPFAVLPIAVALMGLDRALIEAAHSLGARPWDTFHRVVLPLSLPGVAAGWLLVFAMALGFFVTPALLGGGRVLVAATFIYQQVVELLNWPVAAAGAIVLLALVTGVIALSRRLLPLDQPLSG